MLVEYLDFVGFLLEISRIQNTNVLVVTAR